MSERVELTDGERAVMLAPCECGHDLDDPDDPDDCTTTPVGFTHVDPHWQPSPTPSTEINREDS